MRFSIAPSAVPRAYAFWSLLQQAIPHVLPPLLFYDESLRHRLSKGVANADRGIMSQILRQADTLFAGIPRERFDFDTAKAEVMRRTNL